MCLVAWIGWYIMKIWFWVYVDNNFSFEHAEAHIFYAYLNCQLPLQQACLLDSCDNIDLPMMVAIPDDAHKRLLSHISEFINIISTNCRHTLCKFQSLAGYANWVFNIYTLGRPSLCNVYAKLAGKTKTNACIYLNSSIMQDLQWLAQYIHTVPPICIFSSISWDPSDVRTADICQLDIFTDASSITLAYYFPSLKLTYHAPLPSNPPLDTIFWFKALAACSAIHHAADVWASNFSPKLDHLWVYTDNMNTVNMFNTLHTKPPYNQILISSINTHTRSSLDVHAYHISGDINIIADAISHNNFMLAYRHVPSLTILSFTPPQNVLGASTQ
jgi:hypothetical protein